MEMNVIDPVEMDVLPQNEVKDEEIVDARQFDPNAIYLCNLSDNPDPEYATIQSSGMDVRAWLKELNPKFLFNCTRTNDGVLIHPGGRALIPTGLHTALPMGLEIQVRPRSGLALKNGITVLNSPGTVDGDYRSDIGIILINHGTEAFEVKNGDRIAQLVVSAYAKVMRFEKVNKVEELPTSERMFGGFGSTGIQ